MYVCKTLYHSSIFTRSSLCPLYEPIAPSSFHRDDSKVLSILFDNKYRKQSIERLSGAIQIDTQISDHLPDVPDSPETWEKFKNFHQYLEEKFPLVYENLEVERVNTYGLIFHWKGLSPKLKPVLLMAHQDTVPVQKDTIADWSYPPLSGHYDGQYIYGRGAADCKNVLIAILETLELLISQDYQPRRSIIAAFGFDEESSGYLSAGKIAKRLEKKFGKDSMYAIIDEGNGLTVDSLTNTIVAIPGTGEKGYVDISVELTTPGGHSSIPPDHTSIGIVAELAYLIEKDPYKPVLTNKNPTLGYYQCLASHDSKKKIDFKFKKTILKAGSSRRANNKLIKYITRNKLTRYLIGTSQALDIIRGGEKNNALPEVTKLLVNHRVAIESNIDEIKEHFVKRVIKLAKKHKLSVKAFGKRVYGQSNNEAGEFVITESGNLPPAPPTPLNDKVWAYLAGVTRHVFEDLVFPELGYPIITSPAIMTGNTDTRHYWNLSKNIFRYSPYFVNNFLHDTNAHSVDEKLNFDGHLQLHAFFYEYLQAIDTKEANN
ncbi:Gly-X carboxypeptidase [Spathaspora passalidarum NRRL Y-27907]|uniref:Gly-X carboxypeptidase n=1 Tax=Spathaspora passalidarum (strain NRRL Y-27907 / 11-Y1) TaxID=619300 RepID=G3AT96_SPAPN|nr:Gly-X carboxypeptidase [Spathaspora passalidarum NRRL Y-27907]EGW30859.1 Gly-X carboxypeptidase [Spathaspora passalidarum NRRL Y-27907]